MNKKKMNVLLIFTDQQRYDTIEALGNPIIKTPVLNKLVENGISFNKAYTPCPVCVGARYSMLTGQLPHRTGCADNEPSVFRESLMQILSNHGYQTMGVGKMHFTLPDQTLPKKQSLDTFIGSTNIKEKWGFDKRATSECDELDDYKTFIRDSGYGHVSEPSGERSEMYYIPQPSQLPANLTETAWVVNRSIDYLRNRDIEKPFFMMTSFQAPHPPFVAPFPWNKFYRGADMPLPKKPDGYENFLTLWNKYQNRYKYMDQGINNNHLRTMKAYYYASISFIDYNLGLLLNYLESEKLMDNTMILFASDHGELLGDYNAFGKRCFLDSAARIPLLMRYPGCKKQISINTPVSLVDILPTVLEFTDIESQNDYSGESLFGVIKGNSKRDVVYGQFQRHGLASYMAINENYKYIYSAPDDKELLFNQRTDPEETRNIAGNSLYLKKTEEMRGKLIDFLKAEGYLDPIQDNGWKKYSKREIPQDPDSYLLFQDDGNIIPEIDGYKTDANSLKYFKNRWYE